MINPKTNKRELAYIVEVKETKPLDNYDHVHYIRVLGWWCVATKSLNTGDKAVYFEIDSLLPKGDKRFSFMEKKRFRVKTQKICKVWSQGLVLSIKDFPELKHCNVGDFVTEKLNVTLFEKECLPQPIQKKDAFDKAKDRHQKFFKNPIIKLFMKWSFFRFLMKKIFIKCKDKIQWPSWLPKTGSERIQNLPELFDISTVTEVVGENEIQVKPSDLTTYVISEKVDGMSSSYWLDEKDKYYVGSHNIVLFSGDFNHSAKLIEGQDYIKNNIWLDMGEKYDLCTKLKDLKLKNKLKTVAIQGESYGSGVQKRVYSKKYKEQAFVVFHIWFDGKRLSMQDMVKICEEYSLPHVYIYDWNYRLPNSIDEVIKDIDSKKSDIDGGDIEGFVFYSQDGQKNFKCVSPSYLLKYHA